MFKYQEYLKFYKPKTIAFDLKEEVYMSKYDPIVRSRDFRESMKRVEVDITLKQEKDLANLGSLNRLQASRFDLPLNILSLLYIEVRSCLR